MGWGWVAFYWYRAHKRTEQRRREMAAMEARLRAEMGLPAMATYPAPALAYHSPPPRRRRLHIGRWVVLLMMLLVLLLLVAFLVYAWGVGVQHGYIYPAHHS